MFFRKDSKKENGEKINDTWSQVFADMRETLGLPSSKNQAGSDRQEPTTATGPAEIDIPQSIVADQLHIPDETLAEEVTSEALSTITPEHPTDVESNAQPPQKRKRRTWVIVGSVGIGTLLVVTVFWEQLFLPYPPAPDVVATFDGGQITLNDVAEHISTLGGEEAQKQLASLSGYAYMVEDMVTDELVKRWANNRNPDTDKDFSHVMKHIAEEVNLNELHTQMHEGQLGVTEGDILAYYDANADKFSGKALTDVRDSIVEILKSDAEDNFVQNYITALKNKASIVKNLPDLAPPVPTNDELRDFYLKQKDTYIEPAQAVIQEIHIPKRPDEKAGKDEAERILSRIRSGEDVTSVIGESSESSILHERETITKGESDKNYDAVFNMEIGVVSEVISMPDDLVIIKLISKKPERVKNFEEVREQVSMAVEKEKEASYYTQNTNRVLFTVNGTQFTLGEFWAEYQELPDLFLANYQGNEGKEKLVERIIERVLLYEDSLNQVSEADTQMKKEEMRLKVLAQMMEQEEIDEKIAITDTEIEAFFNDNAEKFVKPVRSKIRQITIKAGETDTEYATAETKALEAYKKLVPGLIGTPQDFETVAREYSEDETTNEQGGAVSEWVEETKDIFSELEQHAYHERIASLKKGEVSQPFLWNGYFYIIEVLDQTTSGSYSLEEVKDSIENYLRTEKHSALLADFSKTLMEEADVTIYLRTLKKVSNTIPQ